MEKNKNSQNQSKANKLSKKNSKNKIVPQEKSTRFKDSYYNPKLHKRNWEPSGAIKEKNKYVYGDTGLAYNLQDTKLIQKDKSTLDKTQIHFLEFDFLEENDIIIIIEHCSNCEEHLTHTNHVNNIYKNIAKLLQQCINLRYPFIKVYLKPIDINNKTTSKLGALEIQLGMKINDNKTITTLFSKLTCNQWPNFNNILNKINSLVPLLDIKCTIYDKEEDVDNSNNSIENMNDNNDNNLNEIKNKSDKILLALPSKYENIKINLYSLKNKQIELYCKEAANQLDIAFNPKRKAEIYYEEQNKLDNNNINDNESNIYTNSKINSKLNLTQKNILLRPESSLKNKSMNNTFNYSVKNNSTLSFSNFSKRGDLIEDQSLINDLKGKLLSTGYVDKSGILIFENVPYDSYLIEVESSKIFLGCGMPILFQKIYNKNNSQKPENKSANYLLNKIFGLKRQIDAFVEVYLFSKNEKNDFSGINLISDARVVLIKKFFESGDIVSGNVDELELEENKNIKGRYEIVTEAGEAELNVSKKGYNNIYKKIKLKNGINKINIELIE